MKLDELNSSIDPSVNGLKRLKRTMTKEWANSYYYHQPFNFSAWQLRGDNYWPVGFFDMNSISYFDKTFYFYLLNEETGFYTSQYRTKGEPSSVKYSDNGKNGCYYFYYENGLMLAANL